MKNIKIIVISIIVVAISICLLVDSNSSKTIYSNNSKKFDTSNAISMLYEESYGSGRYVEASDDKFDKEGYVFNETLSSCENGSTLVWNEETHEVELSTMVSDKCYIYFDLKS